MSKSFGYLNEGNPLTIRDNEAQIMVNCAVERGWLEYKSYPVPTDIYECIPNRQAKLPNGTLLRLYNGSDYYSASGYVRAYDKNNDTYNQFGIRTGDLSANRVTISGVNPVKVTSSSGSHNYGYYCECVSSATVGEGIQQISLPQPQIHYSGNSYGSYLQYNSDFIDYSVIKNVTISRNGGADIPIDKSQYSILDSGNGYPVIVFSNPVPQGATDVCKVTWNYAFHDHSDRYFIVKETQQIFYAVTVKESANNYNHGYESSPYLKQTTVVVDSSIGFAFVKITATIPSDTGAVTPELNFYRMPFGGSEYLFDFLTDTAITNRLDSNSDNELGKMLETEGNTDFLYNLCNSIMIHNDRLFIATGKLLYYSKPSQFDQFPAENFYAFSDEVLDLCKYDSNLAVFTKTRSYIIYGAGTDGFVISEVDWKTLWHIGNSAQSIYTKLISLVADEEIIVEGEKFPTTKRRVVCYNHRYAQDISLRVKDSLNKGVSLLKANHDLANRNTVIENRYYVAELRYYESLSATAEQVKKFNLVYDVIADGFCLYDASVKDFNNQSVFKYRTKEFKTSTSPTPQAQYHKGVYVKGKGTFKVNVYADGELVTSLTHNETDNEKPLRIILHNIGNKRASTISLEFIGTQGAQIHDWEVYD